MKYVINSGVQPIVISDNLSAFPLYSTKPAGISACWNVCKGHTSSQFQITIPLSFLHRLITVLTGLWSTMFIYAVRYFKLGHTSCHYLKPTYLKKIQVENFTHAMISKSVSTIDKYRTLTRQPQLQYDGNVNTQQYITDSQSENLSGYYKRHECRRSDGGKWKYHY